MVMSTNLSRNTPAFRPKAEARAKEKFKAPMSMPDDVSATDSIDSGSLISLSIGTGISMSVVMPINPSSIIIGYARGAGTSTVCKSSVTTPKSYVEKDSVWGPARL